jgi:hypothetical protein
MKVKKLLLVVLCFASFQIGLAIEPDREQSTQEEMFMLQNEFKEGQSLNQSETRTQELNISSWPQKRPAGTPKQLTVENFRDSYDLYIWWEQGYLFAEAVPLNNTEPFICSPNWAIVQSVGSLVTIFDTVNFESEDDTSLCEDITSPKVFAVVQWELIYDYYADFNAPFNLVSTRDPFDLIRVNGGVNLSTSTTTTTSGGTIGADLTISIPAIDYKTLSGTQSIFLELKYNGDTANGIPTWALQNSGFN